MKACIFRPSAKLFSSEKKNVFKKVPLKKQREITELGKYKQIKRCLTESRTFSQVFYHVQMLKYNTRAEFWGVWVFFLHQAAVHSHCKRC